MASPKNIPDWFWFFLFESFDGDPENFFKYYISSGKEGIWTLDFPTKEIELFFLNRMICYKRYFLQERREYQSK